MLNKWLLPGLHVATLEQSVNGGTVKRMPPGMGRTCGSIITHHQPSRLGMARAAPSPSDPSCTLTSQKHRTIIKPEHWSEDTEGKTPLQPLKITEASLASPQVLSLRHCLTSHPKTPRPKHRPGSLFDFPPLNAGVKISSCEGSGTGNTRNTRN